MTNAPVQGSNAFSFMQQVQGTQAQGKPQGRGEAGMGSFGELMEKAAGILETAKSQKGNEAAALPDPRRVSAGSDISFGAENAGKQSTADKAETRTEKSTDRTEKKAETTDKPEKQETKKVSGQDDKNDARVTDDEKGDKLQVEADDAGRQIVSEIAAKLEISEEDVMAVMETLGLTAVELLDPANIAAVLTELSGESDPMVLVTDAGLYEDLQDLTQMAEEFTEELDLSPEDIKDLAEEIKLRTAGEEKPEQIVQQEEEAPVKVSMTETDSEGNTTQVTVTLESGGNVVAEQVNSEAQPHEQGSESGKHSKGGNEKHETGTQNLTDEVVSQIAGRMTDNANVNFNNVLPTEQVVGTQTQEMVEIVRQITEQIRVNFGADVTSMELTLHPASLGNVQLTVAADSAGKMVAQFTVENETVRSAIESQLSSLQQRLDEQGVKIEAVEVTVASHSFEGGLNQQAGQQSDREREAQVRAAGQRTRRINLSDLDLEDEELTEEERITAEMMAANGNTVDYTA